MSQVRVKSLLQMRRERKERAQKVNQKVKKKVNRRKLKPQRMNCKFPSWQGRSFQRVLLLTLNYLQKWSANLISILDILHF